MPTDFITKITYSKPTFFVKLISDTSVKTYPIKSDGERAFFSVFPNDMELMRGGLLPKGSKVPNESVIIIRDFAHLNPNFKTDLLKQSNACTDKDKFDKMDEDLQEVLTILKQLHDGTLYQINASDKRTNRAPYELFDTIEALLHKHKNYYFLITLLKTI